MIKLLSFLFVLAVAHSLVCPPNSSQRGNVPCATGSPNPSVNSNQCCCNFGFQANANATLCVTSSGITCPPNSSQRGNVPCATGSPNPEVNNGLCCCFFNFEANATANGCVPVTSVPLATCPAFSTPKIGNSCPTGIPSVNAGGCCCFLGYIANATGTGCIPQSTTTVVNICSNVVNGGCTRYVRGFDVTGVTNFVSLTVANGINTACDCLSRCKTSFLTCAAWVWKFTDNSGVRTCTLYSDFNLPPNVTLGFNLGTSVNSGVIGMNPQTGSLVPHCTTNGLNNGTNDPGCISGELWALDNNNFYC